MENPHHFWQFLGTLRRFRAGESVEQIAAKRQFTVSTIYGHLATAIEAGEKIDMNELLTAEAQEQIAAAFKKFGFGNIGGARESLGNKFDYGLFRIYRAAKQGSADGSSALRSTRNWCVHWSIRHAA